MFLKDKKNKIHSALILTVIIVLAAIRLCFIFSKRDGHHVDEIWSYGFANSYYSANVYGWDEEASRKNIGEWVKGDVFKDYITVNEGEEFSFGSVMFNKSTDLSPVVYALILHFVSSFFPGVFSYYIAFFIGLVFFVPCVVFIYLISKEFTSSTLCGLLCSAYYVISGTGTANFLYLRIYHIFTFFTLVLFYLIMKLYKKTDGKRVMLYVLLSVVTILGCLTHYYFLVIAFFITAFFDLLLLVKKRYRTFVALSAIMLVSVAAFFVIYPESLNFLLPYIPGNGTSTRAVAGTAVASASSADASLAAGNVTGYYKYPYSWELRIANIHFFGGTIGFSIGFDLITVFEKAVLMLGLLVILGLFVFLFRNESWMKKSCSAVKGSLKKAFGVVKGFLKKQDPCMLAAILSSVAYLLVIPYSARIHGMGWVERYFFPAMTLTVAVFVSFVFEVFKEISDKKKITGKRLLAGFLILLMTGLSILSNRYIGPFRFDYMKEKELTDALRGHDCYVSGRFVRDMIWLSPVLAAADDVYVDIPLKLKESQAELLEKMPEIGPDCLILVAADGFLTDEQMEEMTTQGTYEVGSAGRSGDIMTIGGFINLIESKTGFRYACIGEYETNIGVLKLYKCSNS